MGVVLPVIVASGEPHKATPAVSEEMNTLDNSCLVIIITVISFEHAALMRNPSLNGAGLTCTSV